MLKEISKLCIVPLIIYLFLGHLFEFLLHSLFLSHVLLQPSSSRKFGCQHSSAVFLHIVIPFFHFFCFFQVFGNDLLLFFFSYLSFLQQILYNLGEKRERKASLPNSNCVLYNYNSRNCESSRCVGQMKNSEPNGNEAYPYQTSQYWLTDRLIHSRLSFVSNF